MNIYHRPWFLATLCALAVSSSIPAPASPVRARGGTGWTEITVPASGPQARAGHSLTSLDGKAYLFGGNGSSGPLNDLWRFDSATGAFVEVNATNPPPARRNHAATEFRGKLFVFGGLGTTGGQFLDDLWTYDPSTNAWTEVTPEGSRPDARAFHQIIANSDRIYLGGGFGASSIGAFVDRWSFNPASSTWTRLFPAASKGELDTNLIIDPCGRYGAFGFFLILCSEFGGGGLDCLVAAAIAFGGESFEDDSKLGTVHADVYQMDLATGGFKQAPLVGDVPPGLVLGAVTTYAPRLDGMATKAIIIGGELGGRQRSNRTFIVQGRTDPTTIEFTNGPDFPVAVSETAAAYIADFPFAGRAPGPAVIVFGGHTDSDSETARLFVLPAEAGPAVADITGEWTVAASQKCKNNKCRISGTFVARNTGTAPTVAATLEFYLSDDAELDGADTLIRTSVLPAMAAGGSTTFELKKKQRIKLPNGVSASGKFVIARLDADLDVEESNEFNNDIASPVP